MHFALKAYFNSDQISSVTVTNGSRLLFGMQQSNGSLRAGSRSLWQRTYFIDEVLSLLPGIKNMPVHVFVKNSKNKQRHTLKAQCARKSFGRLLRKASDSVIGTGGPRTCISVSNIF